MSNDADGWDHYLDRVKEARATPEIKAQLTEAVLTLRRALGEDWPSESRGSYHALLPSLMSISGATFDNLLILWGSYISTLEGVKGFDGMMAKLRRPQGSQSVIDELELAGRLASRGCAIELEPDAGGKKPDMLCRCGNLEFLVEVKTLATATETWRSTKTLLDVLAACNPIYPVGAIFKTLSKPHLKEVVDHLERETARAIADKTGIEVHLDKVLKVYLVPDGLPDGAKMRAEWRRKQEEEGAVPRGGGGMLGPPSNVREEYRAKIRINQFSKEGQIPPHRLGVLVLAGNFLFWDADMAECFVDHIIEEVYEIRNIQAVVLVSHKALGDTRETKIVDRKDFVYIRNRVYDYGSENIVIVKNRFCESGLDYGHLASLLAITR